MINKLVSDNEALRREMKLERLRADEARQAARLLEDRLDRLAAEHEARLLEMSVNATLLARKERQVETLTQTVELERTRAREAAEREKSWREEAERVGAAARRDVDAALERAALADGRYNAIASHWKEQGEEVQRALAKMRAEIRALVEERARDDERICVLRDVCEQQESNVRELERQKQEILASFAAYKDEQERQLRDIKREAAAREEEQERRLAEAKSVLGELRWALNVKRNVKGAGEG